MDWVDRARRTGFLQAAIMGIAAVVVAATLLTTVTRLRMYELRDSLQSFNEKNDDLRNVTLLSRISMINQRALTGAGRENAAAYKQEAESALIAIRQSRQRGRQVSFTDRAALPLLNGFNRLMGLPRMRLGTTPEHELVLDLSFQFETYREYTKAIRGYDIYISEFKPTPDERDFALLHRGFCHAMLSQFKEALGDFEEVGKNSESKSTVIAQKLTAFLKALQARILYIESIGDPAKRGELYFAAAAYLKALENFAQIGENRKSDKIRFLTARSLEETGRTKEALGIYRNLIARGDNSPYAVNANRRMYLIGTFLGHDKELASESRKNSETVVKDKEFMTAVTHLEKSATKLHEEAATERSAQKKEISAVERLVVPDEPARQASKPSENVKPVVSGPVKPAVRPAQRTELNLRNEKIATQAENLAEKKKELILKKQSEKIDKLTMIDGNIFYGVVYKENTENIFLYSVLGNLELQKVNIKKREKVDANHALK